MLTAAAHTSPRLFRTSPLPPIGQAIAWDVAMFPLILFFVLNFAGALDQGSKGGLWPTISPRCAFVRRSLPQNGLRQTPAGSANKGFRTLWTMFSAAEEFINT